jgi:cyclic beta-1,2-glucan synthetase
MVLLSGQLKTPQKNISTEANILSRLSSYSNHLNGPLIREEIFSVERMEQYAGCLAKEHKTHAFPKRGRALVPRLKKNTQELLEAYLSLTDAVKDKQTISPAAEWFIDNFHIVEDQTSEVQRALPSDYYHELPKLSEGPLKDYPRIYAIVLAIIAHTDNRVDIDTIRRFVNAYQQVEPLTIGELWAIPITLQIALVEQLKLWMEVIVQSRLGRETANVIAEKLLAYAAMNNPIHSDVIKMLEEEIGDSKKLKRAMIVQLIQRLRDQDPNIDPALKWLEEQLETHHQTHVHQVIQLEHNSQARAQVTVGNIISSMRLISTNDWRDFFESVCPLEAILVQDPTNEYSKMDFSTRDSYRHVIERIARRSKKIDGKSEIGVARMLLHLAKEDQCHIGFFLIGNKRKTLEDLCRYKSSPREKLNRVFRRLPTFFYLGIISFFTSAFLAPVVYLFFLYSMSLVEIIALSLIVLVLSSELAIGIVHHYIPFFLKPKILPRMNPENGVPNDAKTMVVIPTLLTSISVVEELLESLHIHYIGNQDPNLYFALLSDFTDASSAVLPTDQQLLDCALAGIDELNKRYSNSSENRFHLFHRCRKWNPCEKKYLGWERKRGKIHEFNRLLRGGEDTSFEYVSANSDLLSQIKYVITLDSDTGLPMDAGSELVAIIRHPLNCPQLDPRTGLVVQGYGILQPRICIDLSNSIQTRFAKIFSGTAGLDPYTTATSDIYQDLFEVGSFTGKGLYVVDAFEATLAGKVPENRLLSHDLFEGTFARSALVTDVEFNDSFPSTYSTYSKRQHRWVRGDWQIASWMLPFAPTAQARSAPNPISWISRWKIFDNLRRSLVPVSLIIWLALSWIVLPGPALLWILPALLVLGFPVHAPISNGLSFRRRGVSWIGFFREVRGQVLTQLIQVVLGSTFLAQHAWNNLDAIVRTIYRLCVSRCNLLEWTTSSQVEKQQEQESLCWDFFQPAPLISVLLLMIILFTRPESLGMASIFLVPWLLNPLVEHWLSKDSRNKQFELNDSEIKDYRRYARRTWHFFEVLVGPETNWLAPDNFQEDPEPVIAYRTSPTNIGLHILSVISAYDFGYIGRSQFIEQIERILNSLMKLELLKGHLYNWYDIRSLTPLNPQYVSTVDSGNLGAHLLVLKQTCLELFCRLDDERETKFYHGILDTLLELKLELEKADYSSTLSMDVTHGHFINLLDAIVRDVQTQQLDRELTNDVFVGNLEKQLDEFEDWLDTLALYISNDAFDQVRVWLVLVQKIIMELQEDQKTLNDEQELLVQKNRLKEISNQCDKFVLDMDFSFLFDKKKKLFVIGYNATESLFDNSYYDLLASEARLASFLAIAKGDVPREHWFRLGRKLTTVSNGRALISWTATMFEYLMPLLVMRSYRNTLLDQTYRGVISRQIEYGRQHRIPWGVSEAGYNARDLQLNYQYGPFGVPGLGLKRGLSDDLVISPYSTMLAAQVDARIALVNLKKLEGQLVFSTYGFYESIDYTPERIPKNQKYVILRSFMAHHQGMSLVAMNNLLHGNIMQERFHIDPLVLASQRLLQEKIPREVLILKPRADEVFGDDYFGVWKLGRARQYKNFQVPSRTHLLSNGNYTVMITAAGSGFSKSGNVALTRWREDTTRDHWGQFYYIRNRKSGYKWSVGHQPLGAMADFYEAVFNEDKADLIRHDGNIVTHTEIIISTEDNVELRRIALKNNSRQEEELDVTSYMECVLAPAISDNAHPAFSNLFVETEFLPHESAILAIRRPRSKNEEEIFGFHGLVTEGRTLGAVQYETDRSRFLGRGRTVTGPRMINEAHSLSNTSGAVLDPIFSLRQAVLLAPGETAYLTFVTGIASSRNEACQLAEKYHDPQFFNREVELAWIKAHVQLRHLNVPVDKANTYQRLAGRLLYSDSQLRPGAHLLAQNERVQSQLWTYGISGDRSIIVCLIRHDKDISMVRELLHAHEYLREKGLFLDLVIINERETSYLQSLQGELMRQVRKSGSHHLLNQPGGIFLLRADILPNDDIVLLKSVARVVLDSAKGTLEEQIARTSPPVVSPDLFVPTMKPMTYTQGNFVIPELHFYNGFGGFTNLGREYVIILNEGQWTPAPWINVISNSRDFGFIISEAGSGYTWSINSRENRLTPWSNDSISDPVSEAIYIRDEETGEFWSPTPLPIRGKDTYMVKHGQGYSEFHVVGHGISHSLVYFVPLSTDVKIASLKLKNIGKSRRWLSVTSYTEWLLGNDRSISMPHVFTSVDHQSGVIIARNRYNSEFAGRVSYAHMNELTRSVTCDRSEFLGRNGNHENPAAMGRVNLSGATGGAMDPCAAIQSSFSLDAGEEREIIILLGQEDCVEEALQSAHYFSSPIHVQEALNEVIKYWDDTLSAVEIKTPDDSMNILFNRWLVYQVQSCRVWARSAFYQSGGAFGFRDQLQDVMALVYSRPEIARLQIVTTASRQFPEGDVQHWWHPPTGRGVRTRFSDDLLWLPYVTSFYVKATGDTSILKEEISFIQAPLLEAGEDESYRQPENSTEKATLLEHCARTLDRSLATGRHGLPLMGSGDWNDGMNLVGNKGQGESVWMGWFLHSTIQNFLPLCAGLENSRLEKYRQHLIDLSDSLDKNAWDGQWYRRAYFDDGTPLGSANNDECKIDSIAQSWAVLSGAGSEIRAKQAMESANEMLIHRGDGLIKLFTPPFSQDGLLDPGYIKGYLPGVRENGGQYTHAAIWLLMAFAKLGDGERAEEIFSILNPINHSLDRVGLHRYKVEPYVMAADVYGQAPHIGRGGWTWYTGSASWMYRAALESILGFELKDNIIRIQPQIPRSWPGFEMTYRRDNTEFRIKVKRQYESSNTVIFLDGIKLDSQDIPLSLDGGLHLIEVEIPHNSIC